MNKKLRVRIVSLKLVHNCSDSWYENTQINFLLRL